jgi:transposase
MRNPVPPIRADEAALQERRPRAHDGHRTPRVQRLFLLVTQQAQDRQAVARLLGIHRHTVGRWLARYAAGGLDAWLATYVPTGTPVSLAPEVLASLEQALHRAAGFASDEALRQWVRRTHGVEVTDKTLDSLVRVRFQATRKVARPSHTQKA